MRRKYFALTLCAMLFALCSSAEAQQPGKIPRMCFLSSRSGIEVREEAFRQGLRDLGYFEGKNILVEWRFAKNNAERFPALAAELLRVNCDVMIAGGSEATKALKNATSTIPIVFSVASDPVEARLVASLS